jgi:hypothetical protein
MGIKINVWQIREKITIVLQNFLSVWEIIANFAADFVKSYFYNRKTRKLNIIFINQIKRND